VAKLSDYPHLSSGKVRDLYEVDDELLLMVASDRISAFDYILPTVIPDKGRILTAMSMFFFELLADIVPNHVVAVQDPRIPVEVLGRALLVRRLQMVQVECVARGYLTGSGLLDYQQSGSVCGVGLPAGLLESSKLDQPIFTPAAKAPLGLHDENVTFETVCQLTGDDLALRMRDKTLEIYHKASVHAAGRGIILADTKFEFGFAITDTGQSLILADEVLTPDSSRFWPAQGYLPGRSQPSYDKQFVRDWLLSSSAGWDRSAHQPPPPLPADVVAATRERYLQGYEKVSGRRFADWIG